MMFTPTPPARRPRPPGTLNRTRQKMTGANVPKREAGLAVGIAEAGESDTPLSAFMFKQKDTERSLSNASPADASDVSLILDMPKRSQSQQMAKSRPLSMLSTGSEAQPSPPPPYDPSLPTPLESVIDDAQTPPRQDSGLSSRRPSRNASDDVEALDMSQIEEHLRVNRAAEAARSLGLEMNFEMERSSSTESRQPGMSPEGMKKQLRETKLRLRQRDNELVMAAKVAEEVLKSHEALLASLPTNFRSQLPQMFSAHVGRRGHHRKTSSTSSSRSHVEDHLVMSPEASFSTTPSHSPTHRVHTVHARRRNIPRFSPIARGGQARSPNTTLRLRQLESDERIASLEQLLAEAHEGEEAQRKQAARLRRDLNKLQREFSAAETRYADDRSLRLPRRMQSGQGLRGARKPSAIDDMCTHSRSRFDEDEDEYEVAEALAWESRPGPSRRHRPSISSEEDEEDTEEVAQDLSNLSAATIRATYESRYSSMRIPSTSKAGASNAPDASILSRAQSLSRKSSHILLASALGKIRKKISLSSFLSPPKATRRSRSPGTPPSILLSATKRLPTSGATARTSISIHAPSTRSSRASKRTPYPSPTPSLLVAPPTDSPSPSRFFRSPSAALGSLSSRVSSLRLLVSSRLGRSLGSELGSAFGDDSLPTPPRPAEEDGEEWTDEEIYSEDGCTPARLPPGASAALSSLALALAPSHIFAPSADSREPILPRGALREPGLDHGAYELLAEAVKNRKITWVESTTPPFPGGSKGKGKRKSTPTLATRGLPLLGKLEWAPVDPWEAGEYSDEHSTPASAKRPGLWRNVSSSSTVALAHRRLNTSQMSIEGRRAGGEVEVRTVPGKVVNDMVAMIAITLEWIEVLAIIVIKVGMDVRYNHQTKINWRQSDGRPRKTYYF